MPDPYQTLTQDGIQLKDDLDKVIADAGTVITLDLKALGNILASLDAKFSVIANAASQDVMDNALVSNLVQSVQQLEADVAPFFDKTEGVADADGDAVFEKVTSMLQSLGSKVEDIVAKMTGN